VSPRGERMKNCEIMPQPALSLCCAPQVQDLRCAPQDRGRCVGGGGSVLLAGRRSQPLHTPDDEGNNVVHHDDSW